MKRENKKKADLDTIYGAINLYKTTDMGWAEIARKVGVSEQTLYYYQRKLKNKTKNKEDKAIESSKTEWLGR